MNRLDHRVLIVEGRVQWSADGEMIGDGWGRPWNYDAWLGLLAHGTLLQPLNGRSAMRDAYEESLDLVMYLRQIREEHRLLGDRIRNLADQVAAHGGLVGLVDDLHEIANILYPDQEA